MKRGPSIAMALACAALALVAGCGGDDDGKPKVRANETDMAFATQMIPHHERGIDAAELARTRARDPLIRRTARDLLQLQPVEVQTLRTVRRLLGKAGVEEGDLAVAAAPLDLNALREAADFDRAFADALISHHETAIRLAAAERRGGEHAELRRMSGDITDLARFQIGELERWRRGR
jgi:uncharacterized protein (DUF305 family)